MTKPITEIELHVIAEKHDKSLQRLHQAMLDYQEAERKLRKKHKTPIFEAIEQEITTRTELHNAIVDSEESLWDKIKTRTVGNVKYGWRKKIGSITIVNEDKSIAFLQRNAPETIQTQYKILKTKLKTLSASLLAKAGIELHRDTNEVVVQDTIGDLAKSWEAIKKNGWGDVDEN